MRRALPHLFPLLGFLALTLWVTWPLAATFDSHIFASGDCHLNCGLLRLVQQALLRHSGSLFDINVYWPFEYPLAYGELMLTQSLLAMPVRAITTAPAALYNVSLMQGYFFSAASAYALAWFYFRSRGAATLAGLVYGFALARAQHASHLQLVHGEFLPLMALGVEWTLAGDARRRKAGRWLLGAAALGQWLASWYWAVFTFWTIAPYAAARLWMRRRRLDRSRPVSLLAPLAIAALLVAPLTLPYLKLRADHIMLRPAETSDAFAARPADFFVAPDRNLLWSATLGAQTRGRISDERWLWPGATALIVLAIGCAAAALPRAMKTVQRNRRRDRRFPLRLWCVVTLLLLSFCLGPWLEIAGHRLPTPYGLLNRAIPFADQVRAPARWIFPAMLGVAMLAAWVWQRGAALLASCARCSHRRRWFGAALLALATLEHLPRPLPTIPVPTTAPPLERWLDGQPYPSPTLILPTSQQFLMIRASFHRQPLVDGSNGYRPPLHALRMDEFERFPDDDVVEALRAMEVRLVAIDLDAPGAPSRADWATRLSEARRRLPGRIARTTLVDHWFVVELTPTPEETALSVPSIGAARWPEEATVGRQ